MKKNKDGINSVLDKFTKIVGPVIEKVLALNVDKKFHQTVKYPVSTGGKRLRPSLSIISCLMLGGRLKNVLYLAAGLEILHNYTLIIDDMIDNGQMRRGKKTCWVKFGNSIAQCVGIDYAATIFQTANRARKSALISEILAKTMKMLAGGEVLDILFERAGREGEPYVVKNRYRKIRENDYFEMISKKTAALFQASCEVGGIVAGAKERQLKSLRKYGFNLGMTFQITDDILDIFGKEKEFKKKIGKDIEERKEGNIVILFALKELNPSDRKKFLGVMKKNNINGKDIQGAMKLIRKTDSKQMAYKLAENFTGKAKKALNSLPQNKWNRVLRNLADFALTREK